VLVQPQQDSVSLEGKNMSNNPVDLVVFLLDFADANEGDLPQEQYDHLLAAAAELKSLRAEVKILTDTLVNMMEGFEGGCRLCDPVADTNKRLLAERNELLVETVSLRNKNAVQAKMLRPSPSNKYDYWPKPSNFAVDA